MGRKYREYSYDDWKRAMELLEKGYSLNETCRILGWPEKKVSLLYCKNMENINRQWRNGWRSRVMSWHMR